MAPDLYDSNIIDKKATKIIQSIAKTMLNHARLVDPMMLRAINEISRVQSKQIKDTEEKVKTSLEYTEKYPNATIRYISSNMVLHVDSDVTYITMEEARSFYSENFILAIGHHQGQ